MRSVLRLGRISVLVTLGACLALPVHTRAQDASGRPTGSGGQDETGRPPRPKKPRGKPKKVIRAQNTAGTAPALLSSVIIRSYPPGAEVFVDGTAVGTTGDDGELELTDVRVGTHRIVLKKDGYREWGQTVVLKASAEAPELEPLLQSENPQFMRDAAKLPPIELESEVTGRVNRDSIAARDGKSFYNEYVLKVEDPDAYLIVLKGHGSLPTLRLVDDGNVPYSIQKLSDEIYQTVTVPHPGFYYLQVGSALDESTYVAGDYTLKVLELSAARGERPIAIGDTSKGALETTDLTNGPGDFYDAWSVTGPAGTQVRITAQSSGGFTPALTIFLEGKVVATSGAGPKPKEKKKKGGDAPSKDTAEVVTTLSGGTYTVFVRSVGGEKTGAYQLSVAMGG